MIQLNDVGFHIMSQIVYLAFWRLEEEVSQRSFFENRYPELDIETRNFLFQYCPFHSPSSIVLPSNEPLNSLVCPSASAYTQS